MSDYAKAIAEERKRIKATYGALFDQTVELLFRHDPIHINFETNSDEYESEARTILPHLQSCKSPHDVRRVVHAEFVKWFEADIAGVESSYSEIAEELWRLWQNFLGQSD